MLSSIKKNLLRFYTSRLMRQQASVRTNVGFRQAQHIGLLYSGNTLQKQEAVHELASQLKQLGKQVSTLCYLDNVKDATSLAGPTITLQEVTLWGKITAAPAHQFIATHFDYLYNVDWEGHVVVDYLLARSKAKCRIGYYSSARAGLFEVMVGLANESEAPKLTDLTGQMLYYTQLLKI